MKRVIKAAECEYGCFSLWQYTSIAVMRINTILNKLKG
jgi:hypothetical protein